MHTCVLLLGKHTSACMLGMEQLSALCPHIAQPSTAMTDEPNAPSPNALTTHAPAPKEELLSLDGWAVSSLNTLHQKKSTFLTTSYSSYFGGKKGISGNKTSFFLLMLPADTSCTGTLTLLLK